MRSIIKGRAASNRLIKRTLSISVKNGFFQLEEHLTKRNVKDGKLFIQSISFQFLGFAENIRKQSTIGARSRPQLLVLTTTRPLLAIHAKS